MPFLTREVTFSGADGVRLAGALLLPRPAKLGQKVPAFVLVAGSGPTDRDGNQGEALRTDLLRQFGEVLAQAGVASLRYDKRGIGASARVPPLGRTLEAFAAWEGFVGDAEAALDFVRGLPEVDVTRAGILGHSEGGLIALHAADRAREHTRKLPAAMVLVSTPGRPIDQIIREQLVGLLKIQQATPEQTRFFLDKNDAIIAAVGKTGQIPPDVPPGLAALYPSYLGRFYQSELALRPVEMAVRYTGPVLILQGTRDTQVSPERDARALDAALRRRKPDRHEFFLVPDASHNLKIVRDSANEPGFVGLLAPAAAERLRAWATAALAVGRG